MIRTLRFLFFVLILRPLTFVVLGMNIRGRKNLPSKGPAIFIANHNSHLDTLVILSLFPFEQFLKIHPVAAEEYFLSNKYLGWFAKNIIGIFPIKRKISRENLDPFVYRNNLKNREFDKEASQNFCQERETIAERQGSSEDKNSEKKSTRSKIDFSSCFGMEAKEALRKGEMLLIFPEGSRGRPEELAPLKSGITYLAKEFPHVPIIPIFLTGLGKALPKGDPILVPFHVDVHIGVALPPYCDKVKMMDSIKERFSELSKIIQQQS